MRLTIAIPTLNRAYCVARAIESALAQTTDRIDVIVSNNGSTDDTRAVVDRYDHPRLRVFHRAETIPIYDHANFLMNAAEGELFVGLSDDDWLEPRFAETVIRLFEHRPEISFAYTRCWTHVGGEARPSPAGPETEPTVDFFRRYFAGDRHVFWCACVTRTADLRRLGGLPKGVNIGDMHFWTQLAFDGPVGCVPELLAHYTYLVDNVSVGIPACDWADETGRIIDRVARRLDEMALPADVRGELRRNMRAYLARTTANQLALNASRGASKVMLVRSLRRCGRYLRGDLGTTLPRAVAAVALPAPVVRYLVTSFATHRSRWVRSSGDAAALERDASRTPALASSRGGVAP